MPPDNCVDVLIIGAGPAGVMCANALAIAGANVRIIDKRPVRVLAGHADGIQPRMVEVLQSYGLAERLLRKGNQLHMYVYYNTSRNGGIECTKRIPIVPPSASVRYPFAVTLHQGEIEALFLDSMKKHGVEVERPKQPVDIKISEDIDELSSSSSYPVKVTLAHLDAIGEESRTEIIRAKFVIGADGAHSWVRKSLGIEMEGEQTDYTWGVVDIVPDTNFPDVRNAVGIHSEHGSCLIIPREGDLVRFYIQLSDTDVVDPLTGRVAKNKTTPPKLISVLRKILHPYELADPKEIEWWTIYIVGQRVAPSYSLKNRVFISGDACHTHSPKAGQGMNASMNDTHNLAWKLVYVLRGWSRSSLLKTYEEERREFAQDLIRLDKELAAIYSKKFSTAESEDGTLREQLFQAYRTFGNFMIGIGIRYSSAIVDARHQKCAENLVIGERMPPQIFVRAADTRPVEIQDLLPADIRFKVLFFVGNLTESRINELNLLATELRRSSSFLYKYSPDRNAAAVFDIITIAAGTRKDINYLRVPAFFHHHWSKVLLDDTDVTGAKGGRGYERFGIDPSQITVVIVRPDGYVGALAPATAVADLDEYFGSFLVSRSSES